MPAAASGATALFVAATAGGTDGDAGGDEMLSEAKGFIRRGRPRRTARDGNAGPNAGFLRRIRFARMAEAAAWWREGGLARRSVSAGISVDYR